MVLGEPSSILRALRAIYTCPFVLATSEIKMLNDEGFIHKCNGVRNRVDPGTRLTTSPAERIPGTPAQDGASGNH